MKFTDTRLENLKAKAERYEVFEDGRPGFGLRIGPSGKKTFIFLYRFDGKPRRMTIGKRPYPGTSLADAHIAHDLAVKKLESDPPIDPGNEAAHAKQEALKAPTVEQLVAEYLERHAKPHKRTWAEDARIFEKDVIPAWGKKKARSITRRDVVALLDDITDRNAPIAANRTLAAVRKLYSFAVNRDIVDASPCTAVKAPAKETQRDRTLSEDEIRTVWQDLNRAAYMSKRIRLALKFMLATGQRKGEVISAEWSEFDIDNAVWTIPASKAKNGIAHRVPLSPLALALLDDIKPASMHKSKNEDDEEIEIESPLLFPSPRNKVRADEPITGPAVDHAIRVAKTKSEGDGKPLFQIPHWTPHDLRRTAASFMTQLGTPRLVVSKILNHKDAGITAVYDRHSYENEKRQALEAWGQKLDEIVTGKKKRAKVMPLRA
jgi:integrase